MAADAHPRLKIDQVYGSPMYAVDLTLHVPTARDQSFPATRAASVRVRIELALDYPYQPPVCSTLDQVFNVNVFAGGRVCLGSAWMPTHQLTMTVDRLWRIFSLDPEVINPNSPANQQAIGWWTDLLRDYRHILPTASRLTSPLTQKQTLGWKSIR